MVNQSLGNLGLRFRARVDDSLFEDLFRRRADGERLRISRALELNFGPEAQGPGRRIFEHIARYQAELRRGLERDLFDGRQRLAAAERKLSEKPTKTAEKERGVAERRIERLKDGLERLKGGAPVANDSRIFAFDWAPVLVRREGERWIVPMRYHLRPAGAPEDFDRRYPGCYNARRDSLAGFWRRQFGRGHAALVITSFFENVKRHDYEARSLWPRETPENRVVQFVPRGHEFMLVPCIWDRWHSPSKDEGSFLDTFALITDEPPPEVAATGHGRCPIFLRQSNLDAWLEPGGKSDAELFALLSDSERPYFEHALIA